MCREPFRGFVKVSAHRVAAAILLWGSAVALAGVPTTGMAQQGEEGAIELEADSIRYDENTGSSLYRGNVVIRRGGMRLTGDEVEVFSEGGSFSRIVARARPSTFRNRSEGSDIDARASVIEYDVRRRLVVFMGGSVVDDGTKVLRGERIIYDLDRKVVDATQGKGRVRLTINP